MSYIYIYIYMCVCVYMEHLFLMFLDHTQWRSPVGRTPLDEWSARPEESYRLCCVVCDLETSRIGAPYIYDISHLRVNNNLVILWCCSCSCVGLCIWFSKVEAMLCLEWFVTRFLSWGLISMPGQSVWDLWWTEWHWGRFFSAYFISLLSLSFCQCSIFIFRSRTIDAIIAHLRQECHNSKFGIFELLV
jgi:hypothetical protein